MCVVETVRTAQALSAALECSLQFPTSKSRIFPIDHPEIILVSLIIVATKLLFPLQDNQLSSLDFGGVSAPLKIDWKTWAKIEEHSESSVSLSGSTSNFQDMSAEKVVAMTEEELDGYFSHISSLIDKKSKHRHPGLSRRFCSRKSS